MAKMHLYREKSDVVYVTQNKDPFFAYLTKKIFKEIDWSKKNGKILDLGCGSGRVIFDAAQKGFSGVGVDYVPKAIEIAKRTAKELQLDSRVKFFRGDLTRARPRQYGTFDYVVLMEVVEHVQDYEKVINFAWGSLKKGGKLLLTTPNDPTFWTVLDDYAQHVRRFTIPQVRDALGKFSKIKIGTVGYPLHRAVEFLYHILVSAKKTKHNPKLFRWNPFVAKLYYFVGTGVMMFDDLFAFRQERGTTIVAIATK